METNGIEPSTSCLQSTLSIVRRVVPSASACSLRDRPFFVFPLLSRSSNVRPGLVHMHTYRSVFAHPRTDLVPPMATFAATSEGPFDYLPAGTCSFVRRLWLATSRRVLMTETPQTEAGAARRFGWEPS